MVTAQDHAEWEVWRRDRKRQQERDRRARNHRIDYYPDDAAALVIGSLVRPLAGHDLSSVISRTVGEWAQRCHRNKETDKIAKQKGPL